MKVWTVPCFKYLLDFIFCFFDAVHLTFPLAANYILSSYFFFYLYTISRCIAFPSSVFTSFHLPLSPCSVVSFLKSWNKNYRDINYMPYYTMCTEDKTSIVPGIGSEACLYIVYIDNLSWLYYSLCPVTFQYSKTTHDYKTSLPDSFSKTSLIQDFLSPDFQHFFENSFLFLSVIQKMSSFTYMLNPAWELTSIELEFFLLQ